MTKNALFVSRGWHIIASMTAMIPLRFLIRIFGERPDYAMQHGIKRLGEPIYHLGDFP